MNTVLVTGAFGQLGTELQLLTAGKPGFLFTDIREEGLVQRLDICDSAAVERFVVQNNVGAIINCAAYTDVNRAESDRQRCYAINVEGPANLARSAHRHDAVLVQISTDYVFDGKRKSGIPYAESSRRHPLSVYGESKRACEDAIRRISCRGVILRTAWLYSPFGKNFVKTMLRLGSEKPEIGVVADQFGTPPTPVTSHRPSWPFFPKSVTAAARFTIIPTKDPAPGQNSLHGSCRKPACRAASIP